METEKNSAFVRRLRQKRTLLETRDPRHKTIRTLLLISGGGMRGSYGAGVALALHHLGFADCFDTVIGVSAGAAIGGYFLTGKEQSILGTTIYYEECRNEFIRFAFPFPTIRIDYLEKVLRNEKKRLDLSALLRHRSEFFVGITHWDTGNGALVNAKAARPDAIAAITASLALTYAYPEPIMVNGQKGTDGGTSEPLPIRKAEQMFSPTDVLIVSNYSREESRLMGLTFREKITDALVRIRIPDSLAHSFRARDTRWRENISYAERSASAVILYGAKDVGILTTNLAKLRGATEKGIRDVLALFGDTETRPETIMP